MTNRAAQLYADLRVAEQGGGLQVWRELLSDRQMQMSAKAELGKLGLHALFDDMGSDRSDLLARRADLRRAMNTVQSSYDRNKPETITDDKLNTVAYLGAEISYISNVLDLADHGSAVVAEMSGESSSVLRDQDGRRVGVMLTNNALSSPAKIAAQLKVQGAGSSLSLGEFFRGVAGMRTSEGVKAALSEGTNTAGGYTVPTVLLPGILNALVPASSVLGAGAGIAVLDTQAKSFNIAGISAIPTAGWRNESGGIIESDPAFRSITVTPRSLAFRFKVSRELLQDSPNLETSLRIAVAQAFAKELDRAALRGTGTAPEIRGILNTVGVQMISSGTNGAQLTNYAKFINAARAIKSSNAPSPTAAIISPREDESMALFNDSTGQPLRRPDALAGWRFLTTSQIPTTLTVGSSTDCSEIYVGDFTQFAFFIREGVSIHIANELYAESGEIGFICHTRVDVAALYPAAFAVVTGVRA